MITSLADLRTLCSAPPDLQLINDIDFEELRRGDVLTLVGTKAAINKVRESFKSL
jgi:hypothetical protein